MESLDLRDLAEEYTGLLEREQGPDNPLNEEETERLAALSDLETALGSQDMADYAENAPTMIPEEDFEDYAMEEAYDLGFASRRDENPLFSFIDWEAWAEHLKMNYTEVTFDGNTYLIQSY
jgi:hypothetical protein